MAEPVLVEGGRGEGGGQILRTALFLSTLTGRPFRAVDIRAGRPEPGLKAQHLGILEALATVCGSLVHGARLGASEVGFEPRPPRPGAYAFDLGTAGSVPLFLQTLVPVAMLSEGPVRLRVTGGTDVRWSPTIDWFEHVYLPRLAPLARSTVRVLRRGFHPAGGGVVEVDVEGVPDLVERVPKVLGQERLSPGPIRAVGLRSVAQLGLADRRVAQRQAEAFRTAWDGEAPSDVLVTSTEAASPGSSLTAWAVDAHGNRWGADALGERGRSAEDVGGAASLDLRRDLASGATVDAHLADHLAPWIAMGMGPVRIPRETTHLAANVGVCESFLGAGAVRLEGLVLRRD